MKNKTNGFAGTLREIKLTDLIQMCCQAEMSMAICVERDEDKGLVVIEQGKIVHALSGDISGEAAFYEILGWQGGRFETLVVVPVTTPTIDKNSQYLLIEATRLADEKLSESDSAGLKAEKNTAPDSVQKIRVLIVDDSLMMCKVLSSVIEADDDIVIAGTAGNGEEALAKIKELNPDLITLDVNMPVMNGTTALKHIMINSPCPVVIISNPERLAYRNIIEFLRLGAVDFIVKPKRKGDITIQHDRIRSRIRQAAGASITGVRRSKQLKQVLKGTPDFKEEAHCRSLIAIKSGAGGFANLMELISIVPELNSGAVILQDISEKLHEAFVSYMKENCNSVITPIQNDTVLFKGRYCMGSDALRIITRLEKTEGGLPLVRLSVLEEDAENNKGHDSFNLFLKKVSGVFKEKLLVLLLSGAESTEGEGLRQVVENSGTVVVHTTSKAVVSRPLKKVLRDCPGAREADINELAEMMRLWERD